MSAGTFGGQHRALKHFFSHAAGFFHRRRACRRDIHEFIDPTDVRNVWEPSRLVGRLSCGASQIGQMRLSPRRGENICFLRLISLCVSAAEIPRKKRVTVFLDPMLWNVSRN